MAYRYSEVGKHRCQLRPINAWPQLSPRATFIQKAIRAIREHCLPTFNHPEAKYIFKSMYSMQKERERMIFESSPLIIHPYSNIAMIRYICGFFFFIIYCYVITFSIYFRIFVNPNKLIIILRCILFVWTLTQFCMGYAIIAHEKKVIVLSHKKTAIRYLTTYFWIDIVETFRPFLSYFWNEVTQVTIMLWFHMVIYHIYHFLYWWKFLKSDEHLGYIIERLFKIPTRLRKVVLFITYATYCIHYLSCLRYGIPNTLSNLFGYYVDDPHPEMSDKVHAYFKKLYSSYSFFYLTCIDCYNPGQPEHVISGIITKVPLFFVHIYILVVVLIAAKNTDQSSDKYAYMLNNINNYLETRKISGKLRYKILAHYKYKFQGKYFNEAMIVNNLSQHLQYECRLHTASHLIVNCFLLRGLSRSVVGRLVAQLISVVYLPNDVIINWQNNFDGIYFLSYGTVAFYNDHGKEIMHIVDGGIFGVTGYYSGAHSATVTSVTISEIYKLGVREVNHLAMLCPELGIRLKKLGRKRFLMLKKTVDEAHQLKVSHIGNLGRQKRIQ